MNSNHHSEWPSPRRSVTVGEVLALLIMFVASSGAAWWLGYQANDRGPVDAGEKNSAAVGYLTLHTSSAQTFFVDGEILSTPTSSKKLQLSAGEHTIQSYDRTTDSFGPPSVFSIHEGRSLMMNIEGPPAPSRVHVRMNFQDVTLEELVRFGAEMTGRNMVIPEHSRLRRRVSVVSASPVTKDEAYRAILLALEENELTVFTDGAFSVVREL